MARRARRLSPKALLNLRAKLIDEGLYRDDRPEDTIDNRIRPISDSLARITNPDDLAQRVKSVLREGPIVPIPGSLYIFRYMAKTPEIRFDLNPLVQVTEVFSYGFIGFNFHWGRNRKYSYPEIQGGLYQVTTDELKDLELIPFQNFQMNPPK
tara:strand:+ start:347 stop:805 length:459 start_codon:yes stop_codon:yes gene_type:complete